jgi:transposase
MKAALRVRALSFEEEYRLGLCVRGRDVFRLRRAQVILLSARGQGCRSISEQVGFSLSMVHTVIRLFNDKGEACLVQGSRRPKSAAPLLDDAALERLRHLLHQSPRTLGYGTSLWSLALVAQAAQEQGITPHQVSDETIRRAFVRLGVGWMRAKEWIRSPDPHYEAKKNGATA